MSEKQTYKTILPTDVDPRLVSALGEMLIAFGRLEYMFAVAIKRLEENRTLEQVIADFSGSQGNLGSLIRYCRKHLSSLSDACDKAKRLNTDRQDFFHATFAATEKGKYVRFRELAGYADLQSDIEKIREITKKVNSLIEELDKKTDSSLTDPKQSAESIAKVSAPPFSRS